MKATPSRPVSCSSPWNKSSHHRINTTGTARRQLTPGGSLSKDCAKTVQRHIWKNYEELADDVRYTPKYQKLYKRWKETIERVLADAKEKHAMRYTQYRGLAQVTK